MTHEPHRELGWHQAVRGVVMVLAALLLTVLLRLLNISGMRDVAFGIRQLCPADYGSSTTQ